MPCEISKAPVVDRGGRVVLRDDRRVLEYDRVALGVGRAGGPVQLGVVARREVVAVAGELIGYRIAAREVRGGERPGRAARGPAAAAGDAAGGPTRRAARASGRAAAGARSASAAAARAGAAAGGAAGG